MSAKQSYVNTTKIILKQYRVVIKIRVSVNKKLSSKIQIEVIYIIIQQNLKN